MVRCRPKTPPAGSRSIPQSSTIGSHIRDRDSGFGIRTPIVPNPESRIPNPVSVNSAAEFVVSVAGLGNFPRDGLSKTGFLAQKRLARGKRLNHPEAVALIAAQVIQFIRDGRSVAEHGNLKLALYGRFLPVPARGSAGLVP